MTPREAPQRVLKVEPHEAGQRLDAFLAARLGTTRVAARRLLARGTARVLDLTGAAARAAGAKGARVVAGERVAVDEFTPAERQRPAPAPDLAVRILAEGPGWIAVDKPAGVPVHPLEEDEEGTLLGALVAAHPEMFGLGEGGLRSAVLHRLDVDTSGAVLFARDAATWERLRDAFRAHRVHKRYRALVAGRPPDALRIEVALVVARHRPARVRVLEAGAAARDPHARVARLSLRTLERFEPADGAGAGAPGPAALLEVDLETGFLHQIRASLAHRGWAVLGDRVYAEAAVAAAAPRQMLHASHVAVDEIDVASPDPADFAAVLAALRRGSAPAW